MGLGQGPGQGGGGAGGLAGNEAAHQHRFPPAPSVLPHAKICSPLPLLLLLLLLLPLLLLACQGVYLVAEDADAADAWVDALLLAHHLVASRSQEGLAEALLPQAGRRRTGGVA